MKKVILLVLFALAACGGSTDHALSLSEPEPPGDNCAGGGTKIVAGIDDDGNGVLSDDEIDSTSYVCNDATFDGDVVVHNDIDARQLIGIAFITGSLTIEAPTLTTLDLSALARVDGDLNCAALAGDLAMPRLTRIGRSFTAVAARVSAPVLTQVGGAMRLAPGKSDRSAELPLLASIGGDLSVTMGAFSEMNGYPIDLPALTTLEGGLTLDGTVRFSADALARVASVSAGGNIEEPGFSVKALSMHGLVTIDGALHIVETEILSLELPALHAAGSIDIRFNPGLCQSVVDALAAQTGAPTQSGNNRNCKR